MISAEPIGDPPTGTGSLFVVSAPSGAGKTSLVAALLEGDPQLTLSVSFTTRAPRPGEVNGQHYHFVSRERFAAMAAEGAFIESATVFDNSYGTAEATVNGVLDRGQDLLLEIDWQGARQVRERFSEAVFVFILPPSLAALEARLRGRGQDGAEVIAARMAKAHDELSHFSEYHYLIVNDRFDQALTDLRCVVAAERLRCHRQQQRHRAALEAMRVS